MNKEISNEKFNFALGDLELIGEIERNAINCYVMNDVEGYYKWIKAYCHKLSSIINFDRKAMMERFKTIKENIWSDQNDAVCDSAEDMQVQRQAKWGKAMEELEEIYFELSEFKVFADLSVAPKSINAIQKMKDLQEKKKMFPIFDIH